MFNLQVVWVEPISKSRKFLMKSVCKYISRNENTPKANATTFLLPPGLSMRHTTLIEKRFLFQLSTYICFYCYVYRFYTDQQQWKTSPNKGVLQMGPEKTLFWLSAKVYEAREFIVPPQWQQACIHSHALAPAYTADSQIPCRRSAWIASHRESDHNPLSAHFHSCMRDSFLACIRADSIPMLLVCPHAPNEMYTGLGGAGKQGCLDVATNRIKHRRPRRRITLNNETWINWRHVRIHGRIWIYSAQLIRSGRCERGKYSTLYIHLTWAERWWSAIQ